MESISGKSDRIERARDAGEFPTTKEQFISEMSATFPHLPLEKWEQDWERMNG